MQDNRNIPFSSSGRCGGNIVIDTNQIFDSCRDRDCFEDTRIFLDEIGQSIIERSNQVRTRSADIIGSDISVEPVQLSRGFYRINTRFFVRLECEACVGALSQIFNGLAVVDKEVVLFGGEGNAKIFRSNSNHDCYCSHNGSEMTTNLPSAVVETVNPVILSTKILEPEKCHCCCVCGDIPEPVLSLFGGKFHDNSQRHLAVSLGFFSVIRLERPEQYLINAVEYSVPDKECPPSDDQSPCDAFYRMAFPIEEFAPGRMGISQNSSNSGSCPCSQNK